MPASSWENRFRGATAGIIEAAAAARTSTAELWANIHAALAEDGIPVGQAGFRLVSQMRGAAVARRTSAARFQRAPDNATFSADLAAPDMSMRPLAVREVMPQYLVRFDATYTDVLGEIRTKTVSMKASWSPGLTVGDVRDQVLAAAEQMTIGANGSLYGDLVDVANLRPVQI